MQILTTSTIVKKVLINVPDCRDDDNLLILKVWAIQDPKLRDDKELTFIDFSKKFLKGKFANVESIRRSRQKLQQEFKGLRGKNYKERHDHQEDVKEQLNDLSLLAGGTP